MESELLGVSVYFSIIWAGRHFRWHIYTEIWCIHIFRYTGSEKEISRKTRIKCQIYAFPLSKWVHRKITHYTGCAEHSMRWCEEKVCITNTKHNAKSKWKSIKKRTRRWENIYSNLTKLGQVSRTNAFLKKCNCLHYIAKQTRQSTATSNHSF